MNRYSSTPNVMKAHSVCKVTSRRTSSDISSYWKSSRRAHKKDQSARRALTIQINMWDSSRPKDEWTRFLSKRGLSMTRSTWARSQSMTNSLTLSTIQAKVSISQLTLSACQSEFDSWNTYLIVEMRFLLQKKTNKITASQAAVDVLRMNLQATAGSLKLHHLIAKVWKPINGRSIQSRNEMRKKLRNTGHYPDSIKDQKMSNPPWSHYESPLKYNWLNAVRLHSLLWSMSLNSKTSKKKANLGNLLCSIRSRNKKNRKRRVCSAWQTLSAAQI